MWAGLLAYEIGEKNARLFLEAHENVPNNPSKEKEMDQFNNEMGIDAHNGLAKNNKFSKKELEKKGLNYLKEGRLKIINPSGHNPERRSQWYVKE